MEILVKNPITGRWEKAQSPEPILPPTVVKRRLVRFFPNWLMIIMFVLAVPCTGYLLYEPPKEISVVGDPAAIEIEPPSEEQVEVIVDSIFRSIETNEPVFSKAVDKSRFKEWMHYLKAREGFISTPYSCPAGYLTVGYGHNISAHGWSKAKRYMKNGRVTYKGATQLLYDDVQEEIKKVRRLAPHLNKNQVLAVASLFANCGSYKIIGTASRPTPFWKAIMARRTPNFGIYVKYRTPTGKVKISPNLVAARSFEQSLFEGCKKPVKIHTGGRFKLVSFEQAAKYYQAAVIHRDILPAKQAGRYQ